MRDKFESDDLIARVNMPMLIVQGDLDRIVPFAHGRELFERASEPKAFVQMQGAGHSDLVRKGLYDHVWKFLDRPLS